MGGGGENTDKEISCPESGGKRGEEDRECDGRTAIRDLERVGGEWRTTAKGSWRLVIKNVVREK